MAAAGMPMILSNAVGSVSQFLAEGENGFVFRSGDKDELTDALRKMIKCKPAQLTMMSARSHELSLTINWGHWVAVMMKFLNQTK